MEINTSRFGAVDVESEDILSFPAGLLGLEDCRQWVLLADERNAALAWLQNIERPEVALAVVSPRRFVPGYRMRVARRELDGLQLDDLRQAEVLAIVSKTDRAITLNLKAPLVINPTHHLGRQVIANGDLPLQYELENEPPVLRQSA